MRKYLFVTLSILGIAALLCAATPLTSSATADVLASDVVSSSDDNTTKGSCSGTCGKSGSGCSSHSSTANTAKQSSSAKSAKGKRQEQGVVIHLTKDEFLKRVMNYEQNKNEWKYAGDKPCIIDYHATWCGPCKRLSPVLDTLAQTYAGKIYIYKIDIDKERELAGLFRVSSVPTLLFCPMDGIPQMAKGALPKEALIEAIETVLLSDDKSKSSPKTTSK